MKKAVGIIEENLKLVDAVLYVLDARAPYACINTEFDRVLKDKPRLYVINKSDLVDEGSVKAWAEFFRSPAKISTDAKGGADTNDGGKAKQNAKQNIKQNAEKNDIGNIEKNIKQNIEKNAEIALKNETKRDLRDEIKPSESFQSRCVVLNSATGVTSGVVKELRLLLGEKIERYRQRGVKKTLRVMVIGIPNSGKSTLINSVGGKKKAMTGDKPGVTKSKQWVNIGDGMELLDTPGALPPILEDQEAAKDLFFIGSIKQDIFDNTALSLMLIEKLQKIAPKSLKERYKIEVSDDATPLEILKSVAKSRGYVVKGGEIDTERAAVTVLDDFKKTRMGRICLERVDTTL
jgi:ribosome biogenesis GTPase A